jgi:hypothetical protein
MISIDCGGYFESGFVAMARAKRLIVCRAFLRLISKKFTNFGLDSRYFIRLLTPALILVLILKWEESTIST